MDELGKPPANDIQTLTSLWHRQSGTHGGWWALAGFSFQSAIYLLQFFEGLRDRRDEPSKLAETEKLSDIFKPENGAYRLIQVKRTLRPDTLKSTLREAYRTAQLCTPELLDTLVFQIACLHRETPKMPWDVRMDEVIQGDGDLELWGRMLSHFHASDPIIVEPDPLDHLHYLLWEVGVQDTQSFVTRCLGELLEVFVVPSEDEIARLARRLASQFYTVLPSEPPPVIGTQLKAVDFARRAEANSDQDVVVAVRPTLRDFQMDRFRGRPEVFSALRQAFEGWWDKLKVEESRAVPVFWIDGRSGEGKSVLLLQLVQHLLSGTVSPVVVRLSPDELPVWVARQRQRQHRLNHEGWQPIIAVIDDLYAVGDMEEWAQQLRGATDLAFPGIAVIACGPTPERQELERVCQPLLDVKHFTVRNLDTVEMDAFRKWYVDRTGKDVSLDASDPANRLLVIWMFELTQGRSLHDFAQNFRQRLVHHDLLDLAKVILAANALELPAPSRLIAELHHEKGDRFGALCRAEQLHFEETTQTVTTLKMDHSTFIGYRLAHLQIAWRLYCEWPRGYASLAATWARDLAEGVAAAMRQGDTDWAHVLLARLGVTERLAEAAALERNHASVGTKDELLAELYTELNRVLPEPDRIGLLPRWLNHLLRRPNLGLQPDPVDWAVKLARQLSPPAELHSSVALWLWRLSETPRFLAKQQDLRAAAEALLLAEPLRPGAARVLMIIASQSREKGASHQLVLKWLGRHGTSSVAYALHAFLVAARPQDQAVIAAALAWLKANPKHEQAYQLHAALVAANPQDGTVVSAALHWLQRNAQHEKRYELLRSLVARAYDNPLVQHEVQMWWKANSGHPNAYQLLGTLITRSNGDPRWTAAGEEFLLHAERRGREEVIAALLSASQANRRFIELTVETVRGGKTEQYGCLLYQLRRALANHVSRALEYLRSDAAPTRKREVAKAMAAGLSWYPNRAEEFLGQFDDVPPEHAGLLLAGCARSEVDPLFLDCVMERWLCQEYRPKGYRTVLRALKQKPERWMSLSGRGNLTMRVVQDFERLDGKD